MQNENTKFDLKIVPDNMAMLTSVFQNYLKNPSDEFIDIGEVI